MFFFSIYDFTFIQGKYRMTQSPEIPLARSWSDTSGCVLYFIAHHLLYTDNRMNLELLTVLAYLTSLHANHKADAWWVQSWDQDDFVGRKHHSHFACRFPHKLSVLDSIWHAKCRKLCGGLTLNENDILIISDSWHSSREEIRRICVCTDTETT